MQMLPQVKCEFRVAAQQRCEEANERINVTLEVKEQQTERGFVPHSCSFCTKLARSIVRFPGELFSIKNKIRLYQEFC